MKKINPLHRLTRRVPRQGGQKVFAYREEIRRILDILGPSRTAKDPQISVAYRDESRRIGRMQISQPQRIPVCDGLRCMWGQVRKTTGLPLRRQLAPRDVPNTIHVVGESSHQVELRAQLQQATQDQ
ncbi:hypothetical protein E3N88_06784 [Mikania micrantha]|uniref:Uncharacterized protein n=1 Tax=Mikania micrantha TaxID=192012 RepID=A0A5N6PPQ9_9ASTR|nr:hypothetical protein E3N88_06784 [Mikania micrantha]